MMTKWKGGFTTVECVWGRLWMSGWADRCLEHNAIRCTWRRGGRMGGELMQSFLLCETHPYKQPESSKIGIIFAQLISVVDLVLLDGMNMNYRKLSTFYKVVEMVVGGISHFRSPSTKEDYISVSIRKDTHR